MRKIKKYGWRRDLPDYRDKKFELLLTTLPDNVDLRGKCPAVYDQGELGSCTANAIAGAVNFLQPIMPSRLFVYYNERAIEGDTQTDGGAQIRDGIKTISKQGVCPETDWPYDITQFAIKPSQNCYTDAQQDIIKEYLRIRNLRSLQQSLTDGFPVVFGFTVYESFESATVAQTGIMPMPKEGEQVLGGHAVMAVGYDNTKKWVIVRNSWGPTWGDGGYFYMPYEYISNSDLASDFWTIR